MKTTISCAAICLFATCSITFAQGDAEVIDRIIDEGTNRSQIWDHLEHLSYQIGPRLTGSTNLAEANAWTREMFATWGLKNAHLFKWSEIPVRFDRGPSYAKMVEPMKKDFEFTTNAWSMGTDGPVSGIVLKAPINEEAFSAIRDKAPGAWILTKSQQRRRRGRGTPPNPIPGVPADIAEQLLEAGIAGVLVPSRNELVTTGSARWNTIKELDFDKLPQLITIKIRRSDYDAINSRLADGEEVTIEVNLQNHFSEGPFPLFITIAEIPGTEFPDEVIIISGHLDSWDGPGSLGTQDNGSGTSVTLEAARLLMAAGAKPRRTIRFILWTGEEQGLLGSSAYLESLTEEERAKISAVLVDDGGTNYEGGLHCIESMADMLRKATAKVNEVFPDMPVEIFVHEKMRQGGGSDHATFNRVGIPGFFWEESGIGGREGKNYTFIHHTQHDTPRYAVPEYHVQAAVCSAITAYNLAMADTMLPREEMDHGYTEEELASWSTVETPVSGAWEFEMSFRGGEPIAISITFDISADGKVRGTSTSGFGGESKILRGSWDEATGMIKATIRGGFGDVEFEATVQEDGTLKGVYARGTRYQSDITAKRKEIEKNDDAEEVAASSDATDEGEKE